MARIGGDIWSRPEKADRRLATTESPSTAMPVTLPSWLTIIKIAIPVM
jgi:hypothetical protein